MERKNQVGVPKSGGVGYMLEAVKETEGQLMMTTIRLVAASVSKHTDVSVKISTTI